MYLIAFAADTFNIESHFSASLRLKGFNRSVYGIAIFAANVLELIHLI